jgi:DNA-binding IclR family transcriptional regulator
MGFAVALAALCMQAAAPRAELEHTCTRCHPIDVVEAQRLTRREWNDELRKMAAQGAEIRNRRSLLDYLVKTYGPEKSGARKKSFK